MMNQLTRRSLLRGAVTYPALFHIVRAAKPTDIRIEDVRYTYEDYIYRTPIKFGGSVLDRATIINVNCTVRTVGGKVSKGFGSMPMGMCVLPLEDAGPTLAESPSGVDEIPRTDFEVTAGTKNRPSGRYQYGS